MRESKQRFSIEVERSPLEAYLAEVEFPRTHLQGWSLTVACPTCGAPQYYRCISVAGNSLPDTSHSKRRIKGYALACRRKIFYELIRSGMAG